MYKYIFILTLAIISCVVVSCNQSPEDKVAEKIEKGEQLTREDYDIMYGYYIDFIKAVMEDVKNEDADGAISKIMEEQKSDIITTFEKEIGTRNVEIITTSIIFGIPVNPSDFYPENIKADRSSSKSKEASTVETPDTAVFVMEQAPEEPMSETPNPYEILEGTIGPYPIKMWYHLCDEFFDDEAGRSEVTGKYTYIENGTTLEFNGFEHGQNGTIILEEKTKRGTSSGKFELSRSVEGDKITGTFTNLQNGKRYEVKLKSR